MGRYGRPASRVGNGREEKRREEKRREEKRREEKRRVGIGNRIFLVSRYFILNALDDVIGPKVLSGSYKIGRPQPESSTQRPSTMTNSYQQLLSPVHALTM